jgi:hypothetical protein
MFTRSDSFSSWEVRVGSTPTTLTLRERWRARGRYYFRMPAPLNVTKIIRERLNCPREGPWLMRTCLKTVLSATIASAYLAAQGQPDLGAAASGVAEFTNTCRESGERLWGISLCGRLLLVDARNRTTLATIQDPDKTFESKDGLFLGKLPPDILIANTSVQWGGEEWAMVSLPLPTDQFQRLRLLVHESFHRVQPALGLRASDAVSPHLDSESGRLWLRLELRALAEALRTDGATSRNAAKAALLFRAARQRLNPGSDRLEAALEIQEGLAEYTGTIVALGQTGESVARVARAVEDFEDQRAFARSFAYATGPALGLLLDRFGGLWRKSIKSDADLASLLAKALNFHADGDVVKEAESRAQRYGFRGVSQDEHARAARTQALHASYRARFLDGPVLEIPKTEELRRSFNPNNLVPLGESGTVYPTGTFVSRWGTLQVDDVGALLAPDNQSLRVSAPADSQVRPLVGPGWRLELAPGWVIRATTKSGDFVLAPE